MMIVGCTGCHKAGAFDIHLEFTAKHEMCGKCGHDQNRNWRFQFCLLSCMIEWMKKENVAEVGFPCQDCLDILGGEGKPCGFAHGFKQNGICKTCDGKKTVRGRLVAVDPWAEMEKKAAGQKP